MGETVQKDVRCGVEGSQTCGLEDDILENARTECDVDRCAAEEDG